MDSIDDKHIPHSNFDHHYELNYINRTSFKNYNGSRNSKLCRTNAFAGWLFKKIH